MSLAHPIHSILGSSDVFQDLVLLFDQLHLLHGCLNGDHSEVTLFGRYLISIKGFFNYVQPISANNYILCGRYVHELALRNWHEL